MSTPTYRDLPGGSYIELIYLKNFARREKLQSNYFFLCGCVKCKHTSGRERDTALGKKEKEVGEKKRRQRGRK